MLYSFSLSALCFGWLVLRQDAFVAGFLPTSEQESAKQKYESLLEQLETALEDDDTVAVLENQLSENEVLIPLLVQCPPDCPLLQHCAKQGWAVAVRWLLNHGFQAGLGYRCKHRMTLLHFVAWEGRKNVLDELGDAARYLLRHLFAASADHNILMFFHWPPF